MRPGAPRRSRRPRRRTTGPSWGALMRLILVFLWSLGLFMATIDGAGALTLPLSALGIGAVVLDIRALLNPGPRHWNQVFLAYAVWIVLHGVIACTFLFTMRGFG